jgi:hypothetical protein
MADSHFATARIEAFSSGMNRHDTYCSPETVRAMALTIEHKPVIFEMEYGDFGSHSTVTIPAGFVEPNSIDFIERPDGRLTLVVMAKIWKEYSGEFLETFQKSGDNEKGVSVEMLLLDPRELTPGAELKVFEFSAVCVLGDFYTPASPDANMTIVSFAKKVETEYEKALFSEFGKYKDINFSIPEDVKTNACKGLELSSEFGFGKSTDLAIAKFLRKNSEINPSRVRAMCKSFGAFKSLDLSDKESENWIRFQLWGGSAGQEWSADLETTMSEIDEKGFRYFEVGEPDKEDTSIVADKNLEQEEEVITGEFEEGENPSEKDAEGNEASSAEEFAEEEPEDKEEMAEEELKFSELEGEVVELREFKADVEKERFDFEVDSLLKEVEDVYPADELENAKERSAEFTLDTLDGFKNEIRAKAFEFAKNKPAEDYGEKVVVHAIPFKTVKKVDSVW